jgi:hypothetical protein
LVSQIKRLEQILGGKIEQKGQRAIPGLILRDGVEVIYFSLPPKSNVHKQFRNITNYTNPPFAKSGGVSESGCSIQSPDGILFHAISYHGDLAGWRKDIEAGAQTFNSVLANVDGDDLIVADGRVFDIGKCRVEFY